MIRIYNPDGTYKDISRRKRYKPTGRRRGRPRKKHELPPLPPSRKQPYSIILTSRGKQKECLKTFRTKEDAYAYFYKIIEENQKVAFPIKHLNFNGIVEADYEIYIIQRLDEDKPKDAALLRNESGEFIPHDTNMDKWQILDKSAWNIEETFWVFGYDPIYQRKNFEWIFDNLIGLDGKNKYLFKNVLVYQNKLIVDCGDSVDIVFCKCVDDAFALYNELERLCKKEHYTNVMFSGNIRDYSRATISNWIDKLCEVTGFARHKIQRNSLRP